LAPVLLDQRLAIDPCSPSQTYLAVVWVTTLEPRTLHQPEIRFPWGSVLALRCRSLAYPFGLCVRWPSPPPPSLVFRILSAALQPRRFASPEERRVDGAIRCRQLQTIAIRRTSTTDAFAAPRMRTPRGPSRTLWSLHRTVSTSDIPIVTRRHTRVEILFARCAVLSLACCSHFYMQLTEAGVELTCWSEDPVPPQRFPVTTGLSPRTPSVVFETHELSPTSGPLRESFELPQHARTVSPSIHPRPYVRRCYGFLPG